MKRRTRRPPHLPSCRHCRRVQLLGREFRLWRITWELACEAEAAGYATETTAYAEQHPPPTFRTYLVQMAGTGWPMSGAEPTRTLRCPAA